MTPTRKRALSPTALTPTSSRIRILSPEHVVNERSLEVQAILSPEQNQVVPRIVASTKGRWTTPAVPPTSTVVPRIVSSHTTGRSTAPAVKQTSSGGPRIVSLATAKPSTSQMMSAPTPNGPLTVARYPLPPNQIEDLTVFLRQQTAISPGQFRPNFHPSNMTHREMVMHLSIPPNAARHIMTELDRTEAMNEGPESLRAAHTAYAQGRIPGI